MLDLTFYEVGNVLWKECRKGRLRDWRVMVEMFEEFLKEVKVMRVPSVKAVLELP